jgi:hypothetical protein
MASHYNRSTVQSFLLEVFGSAVDWDFSFIEKPVTKGALKNGARFGGK